MSDATDSERESVQKILTDANEIQKNALDAMFSYCANEIHQEIISRMFANVNIFSNRQDIINFSNKIMSDIHSQNICFDRWNESSSLDYSIYAPPQVGKTDVIYNCIFNAFDNNFFVFVFLSSAVSCNQLSQLSERGQDKIDERVKKGKNNIKIINMDISSRLVVIKELIDCINYSIKFIIMGLGNSSTISKLNEIINKNLIDLPNFKNYKKMLNLHDEGDTTIKSEDSVEPKEGQAKSHNEWIIFKKDLSKYFDVKNIFVSATLDAVWMKNDIVLKCEDIFSVEIPKNYVSYKEIEYIDFEYDTTQEEQINLIKKEVVNIVNKKSCEIVLDCTEVYHLTQESNVEKYSEEMKEVKKFIIHTFNSDRIFIKIPDDSIFLNLFNILYDNKNLPVEKWDSDYQGKRDCSRYQELNGNTFILPYKEFQLNELYDIFQKSGALCVLTVAKNMINRGLSVVAKDKTIDNPLTATILFAKPNKDLHQSSITQWLSRLCGTACPKLPRKLYIPKSIKNFFIKDNRKQELIISEVKKLENKKKDARLVIESINFEEGTSKNLVSKNVKNSLIPIKVISSEHSNELEKLLKDDINMTTKIIKCLFNKNHEITYEELLEGIEYNYTGDRTVMEGLFSLISNCRMFVNTQTTNNVKYIKLKDTTRTHMQNNVYEK
jgi:hypothetical protein